MVRAARRFGNKRMRSHWLQKSLRWLLSWGGVQVWPPLLSFFSRTFSLLPSLEIRQILGSLLCVVSPNLDVRHRRRKNSAGVVAQSFLQSVAPFETELSVDLPNEVVFSLSNIGDLLPN